jgi:Condensation domain
MFEQISQDRVDVQFAGAEAGTAPLTWGQKAILQDMRDTGSQFSMHGALALPEGSTVADAAAQLRALVLRHAALRVRLRTGPGERPYQEAAGAGKIGLEIVTIPDDADLVDRARYIEHLFAAWPLVPFDFSRDWPLRMALLRQRGVRHHLVWVLSHLIADGAANMFLLAGLSHGETASRAAGDPRRPQILDVAASEQEQQLRQLSSRTMRYWESQLRPIPGLTFGTPAHSRGHAGRRYWQARFSSCAAHLAMLAIAKRTGTDVSRVTLAVIATAIGRATGVRPLTINVMMSNRFRPGLAGVFAPVAQNSVVTVDVTGTSIDEVVARARSASLSAGMRAYYDPDELRELTARLDAERGYPARVSLRVNDQRAMVRREAEEAGLGEVTPALVRRKMAETSLTWLRPLDTLPEQVSIVILNRTGIFSLYLKCDLWSVTKEQAEVLLRGIEDVAVEAAFDPAASAMVSSARCQSVTARAAQPR